MKLSTVTIALLIVFWIPAVVCAQDEDIDSVNIGIAPPQPPPRPVRDSFGWRLGFVTSGLFSSGQGRPFIYLDTGLRFKSDDLYFDLKFPAFVGAFDFLFLQFQEAIGVNSPFNLFEGLNEPIHYGSHMEFANVKLGPTFLIRPFGSPIRTSVGVFGLAEWVFFDLVLFQQDPDEEFDPTENPEVNDPIVGAVGGFIAFGGDLPVSSLDVAFGAGPDLFVDSAYATNSGWVVFADLDLHVDVHQQVAVHYRTRISTYTHTSPLVFTMDVNFGVVLRLW